MNTSLSDPIRHIVEKREKIDAIDRQIAELICKRFKLVKDIGSIKHEHKLTIHDPSRESRQMSLLGGLAREHNVPHGVVVFPFKMVTIMSRQTQGEKRTEHITPRYCWSCEWRTCGLDDPGGSSFRICPRCSMPLL